MEEKTPVNIFSILAKKISSKLSIQLILSFITMFTIVVAVAFVILYTGIVDILRNNYEDNTIQRFKQCEFNIDMFCNDIDLISRQLVIDANLQELTMYGAMSESEKVTIAAAVLRKFSDITNNYKYIDSIIYYGGDGLIIKNSIEGNYIQYDEDSKNDWYYGTKEYNASEKHKQKIIWFGGYSSRDFGFENKGSEGRPPVYYISASRNTLYGRNTGTLVMNIKESYFISVYNSGNTGKGNMYLIDDNGIVISSNNNPALNRGYAFYSGINPNHNMGDYTVDGDEGRIQVVYYRLNNLMGTLVNETLMSEILKDINYLRNILILLFVFCLTASLTLSRFWIFKLMGPLNRLTGVIRKMGKGNLGLTLEQTSKNELGVLVEQFNLMSAGIKELFEKNELVQSEKRNMEMKALRAQINPHFIYNTLNTIKWMAVISKADNIVDSVTTLSDFLEPIFKNHDILCTMEEEIDYIRNYVKIMNYRFAGGFSLNVNIPEELLKCKVIRFILQPVIENALVHGLMGKVAGNVDIRASQYGQDLIVCIKDDGDGMDEKRLNEIRKSIHEGAGSKNAGIGLSNVDRRIKLYCGDGYGVTIHSEPGGGTEVILKMKQSLGVLP